MLLWATLLVLAPASGQSATAPKPVISLHPPWTTVFSGETVKLTCNGFSSSSPRRIRWYYGRQILKDAKGNTLEAHQSGDYRCSVVNLPASDPVHLDFASGALILQAPLYVFEGDSVVLRCQARAKTQLNLMKIYKNNELLASLDEKAEFNIHHASLRDNGEYYCNGAYYYRVSSNRVNIQVQELFPRPVLTASLSRSRDGSQVTLSCETQLPPQKSNVRLQFCFFRNNQALESGCSNSPGLQISAIWTDYSGFYQCKAGTGIPGVWKESRVSRIHVQRAVSKVQIPSDPASVFVFEGQELLLICSGERDTGTISFSWYKKDTRNTKRKISSEATVEISVVENSHAGDYYCAAGYFTSKPVTISVRVLVSQPVLTLSAAKTQVLEGDQVKLHCEVHKGSPYIVYQFFLEDDLLWRITSHLNSASFSLTAVNSGNYSCTADNGLGPKRSEAVNLSVMVPVSQPVLSLSTDEAQTVEGDLVTFHCEARRGSPRILYQLYREDVFLERRLALAGEGASFSFSLTAEHSGKYYCTASNGFGAQRSKAVSLSVIVPVSQPVLSLSTDEAQTVEGDLVTFHCEVRRGSPRILYQLYCEDVFLERRLGPAGEGASVGFSLTAEHSGNYYCTASNGFGAQRSKAVSLSVIVPVSLPVLTLKVPRSPVVVGDVVELHCEALRGSPPILYQLYHEDVLLGSRQIPSGGGASFKFSLTEEHSGNYLCEASNGRKAQRSNTMTLNVKVPVSHPVFTLRGPGAQAVVGNMVELHCEALRGSPPILYVFYHEDVIVGNSSAPSGGGVSFNLFLTAEHSGNYSCEADNGLQPQCSEVIRLQVTVPVSRPVLTLRGPRVPTAVGDVVELHCEALRGSPPVLYRFYHGDVILRNDSAPSGEGVSFNFSLTAAHSGNYSCEADNGLGAQHSDVVTLLITGLTNYRSGAVASGVTGALVGVVGFAAGALLFYFWFSRKAGERSASDFSRSPSDSTPQETTYHNVPAWIELQPVYINVNPRGGDVVYSEIRRNQEENKHAAASRPWILRSKGSSVIYSQVKVVGTPASRAQQSATSAPHR